MADNLQKVHGGAQPVFAIDTANGSVALTAAANGTETNFIGPAMDFFGITFDTTAITGELGQGEAVEIVLADIAQLATVMLYQVEAGALMSVAVYPKGAYTAATLQTQIRLLGSSVGVNNYNGVDGALVTDVGFKLAVV